MGEYKWINKCGDDVYSDEKGGYQNSFNHPSHFLLLPSFIQRQEREGGGGFSIYKHLAGPVEEHTFRLLAILSNFCTCMEFEL